MKGWGRRAAVGRKDATKSVRERIQEVLWSTMFGAGKLEARLDEFRIGGVKRVEWFEDCINEPLEKGRPEKIGREGRSEVYEEE